MASAPTSNISGLASGIQWNDMIDQIMTLEQSRTLDPVTANVTIAQAKQQAWTGYSSLISSVNDAASKLADGSSLDKYLTSVSASDVSGRSLLSATAASGAVPGDYRLEVLSTATAEKLGSSNYANTSAALSLTGTFLVGGKQVTVGAGDSLAAIRDKINAANTGTTPSGVTASILTVSSGVNRLMLSTGTTGSAGIELTENGGSNVLSSLGLVSSSLVANTTSAGAVRSYGFSDANTPVAQVLGLSLPTDTTFKVNGQSVSLNLGANSLNAIAANINAAAGANTASVVSETVNGATVNRLLVNGTVTADSGDLANSTAALQQIGFLKNQRAGEVQTLGTANATIDSSTGLAATSASKLVDMGAAAGDVLTFAGTRTDGTNVSLNITVDGTTTMQDVINAITANGTGFGTASRGVTASVDAQGRLQISDTATGDSKVTFSATDNLAGGGTLAFGTTSVVTAGRSMQLAAPSDAQVRIDGVLVTRSTNTISDALAGVTLSLQAAEPGSVVDVNVSRDTNSVVTAAQALAKAYNAAAAYVKSTTASDGPLAFDSAMRGTLSGFRNALLSSVPGLGNTTYTSAALVGVTFDKDGQLTVDATALQAAMVSKPDEVKNLFRTAGNASDATLQYMSGSSATKPGTYAVAITQAATTPVSSSAAMGGAYANAATANQMVITDSFTGRTATITLANGDTADSIVSKLNTGFGAGALKLTAAVTGGNTVQITGANYGSNSKITVSFKLNGVAAAQQLGFSSSAIGGLDVVGTINGKSATGQGRLLTADAPALGDTNDAQGLSLLFTGTGPLIGTMTYVRGIGGEIAHAVSPVTDSGTGLIDITTQSLQSRIDSLNAKEVDIQTRLDNQRAALTAQFTAMESAMSKIQAQGSWLTSQINSINSLNSGGR